MDGLAVGFRQIGLALPFSLNKMLCFVIISWHMYQSIQALTQLAKGHKVKILYGILYYQCLINNLDIKVSSGIKHKQIIQLFIGIPLWWPI